jgi:two-component system, LytTR family, response regulator
MKIRTIIVDDESVARARLVRMLRFVPEVEVLAECADGPSAVAAVNEHAPDLVLLDIQMPGMDGFDVLAELPAERMLSVVFVTAYDEFAVRAFEASAVDYLLKPVAPERLMKAVGRVAGRLRAVTPPVQDRFVIREQGRVDVITADQIEWIEAAGNYAVLHAESRNHVIRQTMSSLEARLPADFMRVSRSAILNLRRVRQLETEPGGANVAVTRAGHRVPFTRTMGEVRNRL